jgi:membrane protease YdiL (CAAX protease family)
MLELRNKRTIMTYSAQHWLEIWHSSDTWAFTIALVSFFPIAGYLLFRSLKKADSINLTSRKLRIYAYIILSEWAFVIALLWLSHRHGLSIGDLGENVSNIDLTVIATVVLFTVFMVMAYFNVRQLRQMKLEKLRAALGPLKRFLPDNKPESIAFALIALTAGICEELLYRGWLQNLLAYGTGSVWIGLVLGAVVFGSGHAYQGTMGMIQTGIIGLVFGIVFVFTENLIAGQILHFTIDAVNGIVGTYALLLLKSKSQETIHDGVG